jgi:hypothetical protein
MHSYNTNPAHVWAMIQVMNKDKQFCLIYGHINIARSTCLILNLQEFDDYISNPKPSGYQVGTGLPSLTASSTILHQWPMVLIHRDMLTDQLRLAPSLPLLQALHTAVKGPGGVPMEVQIKTASMHYLAEYGAAAHWVYKVRAAWYTCNLHGL